MKLFVFLTGLALSLLVLSCKNSNSAAGGDNLPKPGTVVDSVSEPVVEDKLNNFTYTVIVAADSNIKDGVYAIRTEYKNAIADGKFTMPKGIKDYTIHLKKGSAPYTYIIGFMLPKDTTFYNYLEVKSVENTISMRYLKSYTFE